MNEPLLALRSPPIIEAVVDIDCDMPPDVDFDALDAVASAALADQYPTSRRRMLNEHPISAPPDRPLNVVLRQGLQALQYLSSEEKQLIQFRPAGFSFNRLAPYSTLDDYLQEIERTWRIFVDVVKPVLSRAVRLRYINRIQLPMTDGRVELDEYLKLAPRLPDEARLTFVEFFNQHSILEPATGNRVNIVMATQPPADSQLPIIFDIEAFKDVSAGPEDWGTLLGRIQSLRSVKNHVFANSLTEKCLNLFRP